MATTAPATASLREEGVGGYGFPHGGGACKQIVWTAPTTGDVLVDVVPSRPEPAYFREVRSP